VFKGQAIKDIKGLWYRVFQGFGQAKFAADGGLILGLRHSSLLSELPLKMTLNLNVVKINSKIHHLTSLL
jgi:hypothetical protein